MLATDLAVLDHADGSVLLIANALNWDATDERVEEAWADAVARLDTMTRDLAAPAESTVSVVDADVVRLSEAQEAEVGAYHERLLATLARDFDVDRSEHQGQLSRGLRLASLFGAAALVAATLVAIAYNDARNPRGRES